MDDCWDREVECRTVCAAGVLGKVVEEEELESPPDDLILLAELFRRDVELTACVAACEAMAAARLGLREAKEMLSPGCKSPVVVEGCA